MIGHSIGELAAACVAGVFSLPDALRVVAARARLIAERVAPGAMLAIPMSESDLLPLLPHGVALGAINGARLCVASGEESGIAALAQSLAAREVSAQRLRATHAYHSPMMESLVEPLAEVLRGVALHPPRIPYVSCLTGTWMTDADATDPTYWSRHLCRTVRFHDGLMRLLGDPDRVFVEVGPGQGLTAHALSGGAQRVIPTMRWSYALQPERDVLLGAAGQLWIAGVPLDTTKLGGGRRVQLPAYPFERQRYWIDPPSPGAVASGKRSDIADWFYVPTWKPSARPRAAENVAGQTWLLVGDDHGLAEALHARGVRVTADLDDQPQRIVHLESLSGDPFGNGYSSLLRWLQPNIRIDVVTSQLDIPERATLRAPLMVAPQEHPGLICRCIELDTLDTELLLDELLSDATEPMVQYRDRRRWLPAYEPVRLEKAAPFRERGVYLITGGLGGVGLIIAEYLAKTAHARLVLIGRSEPSAAKIERIKTLEDAGAEVLALRADVTRADDMRRVLGATDARFGALHGVVHAAGSIGAETFREIRNAPPADSEPQFMAKVRGLMVLDEVLAGRALDFRLLMSSLSAVLGGLGFTAYAAANLFMDAFARRNRGWISVDWDSWRVADAKRVMPGLGASVSEFVMEPEEGADAFARIVAEGSLENVIVSSGNLEARLRTWIDRRGEASANVVQRARPSLETDFQAPRGELESELAAIWEELFGIAPIGVDDNFFALGGHSLLATQLNARLASKLHVEMSLAALLQAPTIGELAVAIVTEQAEMAEPELFQEMLAELEGP
jgi:NADP-dependent 3-hydroxy acid dehydrogenase YdfG